MPTLDAFRGAQGFGRKATGGRGYPIVRVTNLNNSGAGSFREACAGNNRNIVFDVAGVIDLQGTMTINTRSNITIFGQSAPGDGITIKGDGLILSQCNNIIVRFLRCRGGEDAVTQERNSFNLQYCNNTIVDHSSFSWGTDKSLIATFNSNVSFQFNIISESLNVSLYTNTSRGDRGFGSMQSGKNASWYMNLHAHHKARNGKFSHKGLFPTNLGLNVNDYFGLLDWRNNVFYNWQDFPTHGGGEDIANIVGNYYKPGPAFKQAPDSPSNITNKTIYHAELNGMTDRGRYYLNGNVLEGHPDVTANNTLGIVVSFESSPSQVPSDLVVGSPYLVLTGTYDRVYTAQQAFDLVTQYSGAAFRRDSVDARILNETINGTTTYQGSRGGPSGTNKGSVFGIIDGESDVGGYPIHLSTPANPTSTANDGISDAYKIANNLNVGSNYSQVVAPSGYTWLEEYMMSLVVNIAEYYLEEPEGIRFCRIEDEPIV